MKKYLIKLHGSKEVGLDNNPPKFWEVPCESFHVLTWNPDKDSDIKCLYVTITESGKWDDTMRFYHVDSFDLFVL
jgi:hypothetical protein